MLVGRGSNQIIAIVHEGLRASLLSEIDPEGVYRSEITQQQRAFDESCVCKIAYVDPTTHKVFARSMSFPQGADHGEIAYQARECGDYLAGAVEKHLTTHLKPLDEYAYEVIHQGSTPVNSWEFSYRVYFDAVPEAVIRNYLAKEIVRISSAAQVTSAPYDMSAILFLGHPVFEGPAPIVNWTQGMGKPKEDPRIAHYAADELAGIF